MEETPKNKTGKLFPIEEMHMPVRKMKNIANVAMRYWNSAVLQGQSERLTFNRNGIPKEDAHRRSQRKKKLESVAPLRLPRLRSTTFPLSPPKTSLNRSVCGNKRSATTTSSIPSNSIAMTGRTNLNYKFGDVERRQISAAEDEPKTSTSAYEENDLRRRIEEEKRKQRQLQRSFETAREQHQQRRLQELRQLERERERLRAEIQCRVKSEHHLSKILSQQGLHIASPSIARLQNARLVAEHQGEIAEKGRCNEQIKLEVTQAEPESNQTRLQWELMKRPTRK